jgi:DNA-binding response OmpR family regulator
VLAVEDDADTLALMRLVLRDLPLEIEHAGTGAEAIAALERKPPDLLVLDIHLPDMPGWDILEHLKTHSRELTAPVIVLTSDSAPVHRLIGLLQPVAAYVTKPIGAEQLRQHIRDVLRLP